MRSPFKAEPSRLRGAPASTPALNLRSGYLHSSGSCQQQCFGGRRLRRWPRDTSLLIVDDNRGFLDAARTLLEREGVTVAGVALTSADALRHAEALRLDFRAGRRLARASADRIRGILNGR